MRTYQRLVIARGGNELVTNNSSYPNNFIILNEVTGLLKIGKTKHRYNDIQSVGSPTIEPVVEDETPSDPEEVQWPPRKSGRRKKKVADDSEQI